MSYRFNIILLVFVLLFSACFKEDERVEPHKPGGVETAVIPMKQNYVNQLYFNLESGLITAQNAKPEWDLGFETSDTGWHVILNTGNFMWAGNTGIKDFGQATDTTGINWRFDKSDGNPDSTAIQKYFTITDNDSLFENTVYMINRGYDAQGNLRGVKKIVIQEVNETEYRMEFGDLMDTEPSSFIITKDTSVNYVFFSFDNGGEQLILEPSKRDWDLWFTQYTTLLFTDAGEPYPYLVTGTLINNKQGVEVVLDTNMLFEEITFELAKTLEYSDKLDVIGYDWKELQGDPQSGTVSYKVRYEYNYIIRTQEGYYCKLRFIDFYSDIGEKGFPTFEYQLL